jgi:hypothetical protein
MTTQSENKGEEKEMEKICKCKGTCDGGTGWKWKSRDLGNRRSILGYCM